jgi:hypothetical protein
MVITDECTVITNTVITNTVITEETETDLEDTEIIGPILERPISDIELSLPDIWSGIKQKVSSMKLW